MSLDQRSLSRHFPLGTLSAAELSDSPPFNLLLNSAVDLMNLYSTAASDPHCVSAVIEAGTISSSVCVPDQKDRIRIGRRYCTRRTPAFVLRFLLLVRPRGHGCGRVASLPR
jgi:hypothetical protein